MLLGNHKESIKQCDSIESIMTFLKATLPNLGVVRMEQVFAQVYNGSSMISIEMFLMHSFTLINQNLPTYSNNFFA